MSSDWDAHALEELAKLPELLISSRPRGSDAGGWTPVWVVVVDGSVFVRTWQRRSTGWYGRATSTGVARVRLAGHAVDVAVTVVGDDDADAVDAAYRAKYGEAGARSMTTDEPRRSTLRLDRRD